MAVTLPQLDDAFRILEQRLYEQHKARFTIERHPTKGVEISIRYGKKLVSESDDLDLRRPADIVDDILERAATLKMSLCAQIQEDLMNLGDRDEGRQIIDHAYRYRLACIEMQQSWERFKKCPKDSAAAEFVRDDFEKATETVKTWREKLIILAAGGQDMETIR
jgi:hypothetical protein